MEPIPKILPLLLILCLLCSGCAEYVTAQAQNVSAASPTELVESIPVEVVPPAVYRIPEAGLTIEETVQAYFEQQYLSYTTITDIDLTAILDMRMSSVRNSVTWTRLLNQRRRLLRENNLCYVETEAFPYTLRFLDAEELEDDRIAFWDERDLTKNGEVLVHFTIQGEAGRAYPPIMAVNTQHTMRLCEVDGVWKIMFHYFPGSVRKFMREHNLRDYTDEEMLAMLEKEFGSVNLADVAPVPQISENAIRYNGVAAADYANRYTESPNPDFYNIGDWMGDCANFTSQCVWAGFGGDGMTGQWYAGEGGGSPAWENVEYFWEYVTAGSGMVVQEIGGIDDIAAGDVIQTAALGTSVTDAGDDDYRFNHSLVVVDADTLLLAQHSPGCLVYYSDIVNVNTRMLRPLGVVG